MLELFIAALIQLSVVTTGTTTSTKVATPVKDTTIQSTSTPVVKTNIGGTGWDDRN